MKKIRDGNSHRGGGIRDGGGKVCAISSVFCETI
jgi:hypothetical protein